MLIFVWKDLKTKNDQKKAKKTDKKRVYKQAQFYLEGEPNDEEKRNPRRRGRSEKALQENGDGGDDHKEKHLPWPHPELPT
jgi:hypothetical protein